jgi:prevent-host-death family protein
MMRNVPVREAKAKFSELLDAVESGEEVMITRNGKPSVKLVPGIESDTKPKQKSFIRFLMEFPGGTEFERNTTSSREVDF